MAIYPQNNVDYNIPNPVYTKDNGITDSSSRYSIYRRIDNAPFPCLEVKMNVPISTNPTYKGYYYTTTKNETPQSVAKKYYQDESLYWIICKANDLRNTDAVVIKKETTLIIPLLSELSQTGGYYLAI